MEASDQPLVFLSHSSADKPFVRFLADELRASGAAVWLDELELGVGDLLTDRIGRALQQSSHLIACLTPCSISSRWVLREIAMAESLKINGHTLAIIPLLFGGLNDDQLPNTLRDRVYADCRHATTYDRSLKAILRSLQPSESVIGIEDLMSSTSSQPLPFDAVRAQRFIVAAESALLRDWLVEYLGAALDASWDQTARHFIYQTLGRIGGPTATGYVQAGLTDPNDWARQGALAAAAHLKLDEQEKVQP
jgi:hypothetical protein